MTWTIWRRKRQMRTNPHLLWGTLTKQALVGGGLALALVLLTVRRLPYWEEHPSPGSAMASLLGFPTNLNLQRGVPPLSLLIHSTSPTPTGTFSNGSLPPLSWLGSLVFLPILAPEPTGYATS